MALKKLAIYALDSLALFFFLPAYTLMMAVDGLATAADYLRGKWGMQRQVTGPKLALKALRKRK